MQCVELTTGRYWVRFVASYKGEVEYEVLRIDTGTRRFLWRDGKVRPKHRGIYFESCRISPEEGAAAVNAFRALERVEVLRRYPTKGART